ncbi:MAG TPA: tetratricopeptide repeat protein [Candidatus Krumholzibacteria bacterium]
MRPRRALLWIALMAGFVAISSCAYFNTLYNAKKKYNDAQKSERISQENLGGPAQVTDEEGVTRTVRTQQAAPIGQNAPIYEEVIEKCKKMIARYPDSKHVDDAMLLIGKSLFALQRYEESVAALDSLTRRYPKTNLKQEAEFLQGKAEVKSERYEPAVTTLTHFVDTYRKNDDRPEAFYLLCTSLMHLGLSENAVAQLQRLEKDHGRSEFRYRTQTDMAAILVEKGQYKESLAVYERLNRSRVPKQMRYDVWMGMSRSQVELGKYQEAIATLQRVAETKPGPDREPSMLLLRARAYAGSDSTQRAVKIYKSVVTRFGRGTYGAEADYRLGMLYESIDSLKTAQRYYQEVPRAYSGSDYAEDAIKRAGDIGRVLRLQETAGDDSPEAIALRTFSMAEIQLLQFNNTEKAIPSYEKIVHDYPDSEFAPKSAYALGYIYGVVLGDSVKAKEWYDLLSTRYGDSQQAQLAYAFYKGASPPPTIEEMMRYGAPKMPPGVPAPPVPNDTTRAPVDTTRAPADTSKAPADTTQAPADTTKTHAIPDSLRDPGTTPPPDSSGAEPDTTDGN